MILAARPWANGRSHEPASRSAPGYLLHIANSATLQDDVSLAWCLDRLQLAFTALSLPELGAIEKQTHTILYAAGGLPSNGLYIDYATALWEAANGVRSLQHLPPSSAV